MGKYLKKSWPFFSKFEENSIQNFKKFTPRSRRTTGGLPGDLVVRFPTISEKERTLKAAKGQRETGSEGGSAGRTAAGLPPAAAPAGRRPARPSHELRTEPCAQSFRQTKSRRDGPAAVARRSGPTQTGTVGGRRGGDQDTHAFLRRAMGCSAVLVWSPPEGVFLLAASEREDGEETAAREGVSAGRLLSAPAQWPGLRSAVSFGAGFGIPREFRTGLREPARE